MPVEWLLFVRNWRANDCWSLPLAETEEWSALVSWEPENKCAKAEPNSFHRILGDDKASGR